MHKHALKIFLLMFLLGGLVFSVVIAQQIKELRGRAAENSVAPINPPALNQPSPIVNYASAQYGYTIQFDRNYWIEPHGILEKNNNLKTITFNLNEQFGKAEVTFVAHDETEFPLNSANLEGKDNLDKLVSYLKANYTANSSSDISLAKTERIVKNGTSAYKLTLSKKILNVDITYYTYVFLSGKKYYEITVKSVPVGESTQLAENLVDSFTFSNTKKEVKGISDKRAPVALDSTRLTALTSPSVVDIFHIYCADLKTTGIKPILVEKPSSTKLTSLNGTPIPNDGNQQIVIEPEKYLKPKYSFCAPAGKGSGFFISKDGYIATNGHVAKIDPKDGLYLALLSSSLQDFFTDLYRFEIEILNVSKDEVSVEKAKKAMQGYDNIMWSYKIFPYLLSSKVLTTDNQQDKYVVKLGNDPLALDNDLIKKGQVLSSYKLMRDIRDATLVAYDYTPVSEIASYFDTSSQSRPQDYMYGPDIAILKINNDQAWTFPNLNLSDNKNLKEGNYLLIIGYPGVVAGQAEKSALLSLKSSAKPTITRGIVSAIKLDQQGRTLIQTDASLTYGNSGGPGIDTDGNVVGLATYTLSYGGNYNFLRSITELGDLMKENNIGQLESPTDTAWADGLNNFWNGYYKRALASFKRVKELYPIHPTVNQYIADANAAIKDGKDKDDIAMAEQAKVKKEQEKEVQRTITLILGIASFIILLIGAAGIAYVILKKRQQLPPSNLKYVPNAQQQS